MNLKITVTAKDIKKGVPENLHLCPIARAVRRKGFKGVSVDGTYIAVRSKFWLLPHKAEKFIDRFDEGKSVKPFTFVAKEDK